MEDLPPEVQAYYKTLVIFPEDAKIPESVLQLYWEHFSQHDLLRDYLTHQSGGDVASLHKQLLEAYKAKYPGGWHTIPVTLPYYFHNYWHVHVQLTGDMVLASVIADTLIRQQSWLNEILLRKCLEFVDYKFADIANVLLKTNKNSHTLIACIEMLGNEAREEAKRLLKEHSSSRLIVACLERLGAEAKEDAKRLLKETKAHEVIIACLKILGDEASEDTKQLLKESKNRRLLVACLNLLGDEEKEDARRLLQEDQHPYVLTTCLKIIGNEAR